MSEFLASINKLRQALISKSTEEKEMIKEQQELLSLMKDLQKSRGKSHGKSIGDSDNSDENNEQ